MTYEGLNKRRRINSGAFESKSEAASFTTESEGKEIDIDKIFLLKKDETPSTAGKGYIFLAVMAGMMCLSHQ